MKAGAPHGAPAFLHVGEGFACWRVSFQTIEKKPKDRRRQRRKHSVFSMAFSPDPLFTGAVGGGWGFSMGCKICSIDGYAPPWAEIRTFLRGQQTRPPRRRGLRIAPNPASGISRSLRRSFSPKHNHYVGLRLGPVWAESPLCTRGPLAKPVSVPVLFTFHSSLPPPPLPCGKPLFRHILQKNRRKQTK